MPEKVVVVVAVSEITGTSRRAEESVLAVFAGLSAFETVTEPSLALAVVCSPPKGLFLLNLSCLEACHAPLRLLDIVGILLSIGFLPLPPLLVLEGPGSLETGDGFCFCSDLEESKGREGTELSLNLNLLECP